MPWIGPVIGAGISAAGGLLGNEMASAGQAATNAQNKALFEENMQWQTEMSDTAMQRRVTDLKAAGLNPLLAVGEGGASTPGIAQPTMQNPQAPMANIGSQLSSAASVAAQIRSTESQAALQTAQANQAQAAADKTNKEAGDEGLVDQTTRYYRMLGDLTSDQMLQTQNQTELLASQIQRSDQAFTTEKIEQLVQGINLQTAAATQKALISIANSEAMAKRLGLPGLQNMSDIQQSNFGKVMNVLQMILQSGNSAADIASKIGSLRTPPVRPSFNRNTNTQHFNPDGSPGSYSSTQSYDVQQ